ncbi:hypothetical protein [Clavibacter tessellarius]|uniref:hypothetical protein n=1 Tax=Clavibacter tessellarius TaxID=31965 RepID=UPI00324EDA6A
MTSGSPATAPSPPSPPPGSGSRRRRCRSRRTRRGRRRGGSWTRSPRRTRCRTSGRRRARSSLAVELGVDGALPGGGRTRDLWEALATLAAADLGIARAGEPHLDALAILDQERAAGDGAGGRRAAADADPIPGTWGLRGGGRRGPAAGRAGGRRRLPRRIR